MRSPSFGQKEIILFGGAKVQSGKGTEVFLLITFRSRRATVRLYKKIFEPLNLCIFESLKKTN